VCQCFKFESDYRNWDCRKLRRVNLPIFWSEQLKWIMARQISLVYMFSIDRIKFYREWKRCENRLRVNKFLRKPSKVLDFGWHRALVTGFKLHTTIVLKLCNFVMWSQFGPIGFSELKVKYIVCLLTNSIVLLCWSEQNSRYVAC